MYNITPISAFNDNYIWLIQSDKGNVVIDPGDAEPVIKFCEKENIIIDHIICLLYTSPSPRDKTVSRMPSSA